MQYGATGVIRYVRLARNQPVTKQMLQVVCYVPCIQFSSQDFLLHDLDVGKYYFSGPCPCGAMQMIFLKLNPALLLYAKCMLDEGPELF